MRPSTERPEADPPEYLVERVRHALATDPRVGELELDIEIRGERVTVGGTVVTRLQQEAIPLVLGEHLPDFEVENRTEIASREEPDEAESLP
jgi:hypothetical protein